MNLRLPTATYISRRARLACAALLWSVVPAAAQSSSALPPDIQAAIRKDYAMDGIETRYVDGSIDLNADGKSEIIVHVVGGAACGTGGCPTLGVPTIERWLALKDLGENGVLGRLWDRQAYACAPLPDPGGASH